MQPSSLFCKERIKEEEIDASAFCSFLYQIVKYEENKRSKGDLPYADGLDKRRNFLLNVYSLISALNENWRLFCSAIKNRNVNVIVDERSLHSVIECLTPILNHLLFRFQHFPLTKYNYTTTISTVFSVQCTVFVHNGFEI